MASVLLSLDTETGGLNPREDTLLEIGMALLTDEGTEIDTYSAYIQPPSGVYHVRPKALEINGINIVEHAQIAKSVGQVQGEVMQFVAQYITRGPVMLLGWNVTFDRSFLQEQLLGYETVGRLFGHRVLDLHAVAAFLANQNKLPYPKTLTQLAEFLGVRGDEAAHTALGDALITGRVYRELLKFTR